MTLAHTPPTATITRSSYYSPAPSITSSASSQSSAVWSVASVASSATFVASCAATGGTSAPATNTIPSLNLQRQVAGSEQDGWLLRKKVSASSLLARDSVQHPHPPPITV